MAYAMYKSPSPFIPLSEGDRGRGAKGVVK